jgi:hypothetical protein
VFVWLKPNQTYLILGLLLKFLENNSSHFFFLGLLIRQDIILELLEATLLPLGDSLPENEANTENQRL